MAAISREIAAAARRYPATGACSREQWHAEVLRLAVGLERAVADERTRWVRLILQADELRDPAGALAALVNMARAEHDRSGGSDA